MVEKQRSRRLDALSWLPKTLTIHLLYYQINYLNEKTFLIEYTSLVLKLD